MSDVTRWQNVPDNAGEIPSRPNLDPNGTSSRVVGQTLSTVPGMHGLSASVTLRANESDLAPKASGILSTAKNNAGMHTAKITDNSTVEIPGMGRTSVKVAAHLGYIQRGPDGTFQEVASRGKDVEFSSSGNLEDSNNEANTETPDASQNTGGVEVFPQADEEYYTDLIRDIPQPVYNEAVGDAINLIFNSDSTDPASLAAKLGERIANAKGDPLDVGQAEAEISIGFWQEQADSVAHSMGADPGEFYEWARQNRAGDLQKAVKQHLLSRNTQGYKDLLNEYFMDTIPTDAAFRQRGIPTKTQGGKRMVLMSNRWMTVESAVKAGLA